MFRSVTHETETFSQLRFFSRSLRDYLAHRDRSNLLVPEVIEDREWEEEAYEFTRIGCDGKRTKRRASDHFRS